MAASEIAMKTRAYQEVAQNEGYISPDVMLYTDWPWPARRVKGATLETQPRAAAKPIAEGSGTKGSTLTR